MADTAILPFERLGDHLVIEHGRVRAGATTLYSIVLNERFFLEPLFSHYRGLGVGQFLVLDDGSTDGSREFIAAQPDCVLLTSSLRYGTEIRVRMPDGEIVAERAGILFKRVIPERFCRGEYAIYADADEFMILPPQAPDFATLLPQLAGRGIDAVAASLVEFYPATLAELRGSPAPRTFDEILALYPYFDAVPLVRFRSGKGPKKINESASARLFARHGIHRPRPPSVLLPGWINRRLPPLPGRSATLKTPIVRWRDGVWLAETHRSNVRPTSEVLVTLAHFKFTHAWAQKIEEALRLRSFAGKSEKYEGYARLLQSMAKGDGSFLGPDSRRYTGPHDLEQAGLLAWSLA